MENYILLNTLVVNFVDEKKETVSGIKLRFVKDLDAYEHNSFRGVEILEDFCSIELAKSIKTVPGIYNFDFKVRSYKGKLISKVSDLSFVKPLNYTK